MNNHTIFTLALAFLILVIGVALSIRNNVAWGGFPVASALIRDEYFDDRCTVTAVYDKAEIVPWRYGVRLESLGSNQTSFVAIDFEPYRIQFYNGNLTEGSVSMLKESLKMMFPRALSISNNSLPCIYTTWCRQRLSWTVDGPHVGQGGLFDFDGLSYNHSGLSFDIYKCKILMNVTTSQLPSASLDAAIAGYVLIVIGLCVCFVLGCVLVCMADWHCKRETTTTTTVR